MGAGLPKPLLEESLELLAALYCFLAMMRRRQDPDGY
jgi:predicted lipid carrier protein YhbT